MRKLFLLLPIICLAAASLLLPPNAKNFVFSKFSSRDDSINRSTSKEVNGVGANAKSEAKSSVVLQKVGAGQVASVPQKPNRTVPEQASPMDRASAEELKRFPTAKVLRSGHFLVLAQTRAPKCEF